MPLSEAELAFASLGDQARLLGRREVSSRELVELSLARIEESQPRLNAFRVVCAEAALEEAAAPTPAWAVATARRRCFGVPIAIKDDVDLAGHSTPFGCGGTRRPDDAELVRRLRGAGAIIVGKTQAPEVGQWPFTESPTFGPTRNPWSTRTRPGGSSGGAAAAVAAGLVAGAIGSDGAGSVRIPAAWTGLVGLKPQRGRISTWPDAEAFNGLTFLGPLARSVEDAGLLLDAVAGNVPGDLHPPLPEPSPSPRRPRRPPNGCGSRSASDPVRRPRKIDPEHPRRDLAMAERLEELGHEVVEEDPELRTGRPGARAARHGRRARLGARPRPDHGHSSRAPASTRASAGCSAARRCARARGRARASPPHRPHLRARRPRPHPDHRHAAAAHRRARRPRLLGDQHRRQRGMPLRLGLERDRLARDQRPGRAHRTGLPIGAQLLGRENDEATLLALGAELEATADGEWTKQHP